MKDFEEQFKVVEGLILENSFGVVKSEDDVVINVTIGYTSKDNYGWFEIYDENTGGDDWYAEGGLWFGGLELTGAFVDESNECEEKAIKGNLFLSVVKRICSADLEL